MLAEPAERLIFEIVGYAINLDVTNVLQSVEEVDRPLVPSPGSEPGPGLSADLVCGDDAPSTELLIQTQGIAVMPIPLDGAGDEERRIREYQG